MMATSNQADDDDEAKIQETRGDSTFAGAVQVMTTYGREFCFILAVIFTAFAALQNGPLKTRKANPPERFFSTPSLITDFHLGNIKSLVSLLFDKDVAFVMYYAPWDASCISAQSELEIVARYYHSQIFFAAVNCWWPEGECQKKYKLHSYPILIAQIQKSSAVRYTGPLLANYMIAFLDHILNPLVPLQHMGELLDLHAKHEAVLVGFFDFHGSPQPKGYHQYYTASLKILADDPTRKIGFAVISSRKTALKFKITTSPSIYLYLWNTTEVYQERNFKVESILSWAYGKLNQIIQWITPLGTKSKLLSQIVDKAPTMILFTPRNLMFGYSPYYDLVKEIALDYYNCNSSAYATSLIHRIVLKRRIMQMEFAHLRKRCASNITIPAHSEGCKSNSVPSSSTCCQSLLLSLKENNPERCMCIACLYHIVDASQCITVPRDCESTLRSALQHFEIKEMTAHYQQCNDVEFFSPVLKYGPFHRLAVVCQTEDSLEYLNTESLKSLLGANSVSGIHDDRVLTMVKTLDNSQCRHLKFAQNYSDIFFPGVPKVYNLWWQDNFTGLGCWTNKSMAFIAMDTIQFHPFAKSLGIDIMKQRHKTAAIILEAKQESQYFLKKEINKQNLVEFIKNYTAGTLDRHLRTAIKYQQECNTTKSANTVCIEEVTTENFQEVVLNNEKDVVLMYYTPWCGFCGGIAHIFLSVARYFKRIDGILFARVCGDDNDLPWEFTVEKYPSIIIFPAKRKSESTRFPPEIQLTSASLLHFILAHSQSKVRWKAAMQLCNYKCISRNMLLSFSEMRRLFRELRLTLKQLHFVHQQLFLPKQSRTKIIRKPKTAEQNSSAQQETLLEYYGHLVQTVRLKKRNMIRARNVQNMLRQRLNLMFHKTPGRATKAPQKKYKFKTYTRIVSQKQDFSLDTKIRRTDKDEL